MIKYPITFRGTPTFAWTTKAGSEYGFTLRPFKDGGHWCYGYYSKYPIGSKKISQTTTKYVNPIYRWSTQVSWWLTWQYLKITRQTHLQCEGCGEGIIKYSIKNPNYFSLEGIENEEDHNRNWKVCERCVGLYDWAHTRKLLKVRK